MDLEKRGPREKEKKGPMKKGTHSFWKRGKKGPSIFFLIFVYDYAQKFINIM